MLGGGGGSKQKCWGEGGVSKSVGGGVSKSVGGGVSKSVGGE